jgi:hypothetical protein
MVPVRNGVFYFWIFFNEPWHISVDVHEKIINLKVSLKLPKTLGTLDARDMTLPVFVSA